MKIEIQIGGVVAQCNDGTWTCKDAPELVPGLTAVASRVGDSPSIPNLEYARASAVADHFDGQVLTKEPKAAAVTGRVY